MFFFLEQIKLKRKSKEKDLFYFFLSPPAAGFPPLAASFGGAALGWACLSAAGFVALGVAAACLGAAPPSAGLAVASLAGAASVFSSLPSPSYLAFFLNPRSISSSGRIFVLIPAAIVFPPSLRANLCPSFYNYFQILIFYYYFLKIGFCYG